MKLKNNYNECLTNLACSISKYFGVSYKHNSIDYVDKILEEKKPKNVVTILLDGMGTAIVNKHLSSDSFLVKNRIKDITTVFPATTVAATTSIRTGLNPCESGMLGWTMYFDECKDTYVTFFGCKKVDESYTSDEAGLDYIKKYLTHKSITKIIEEESDSKGYELMPFGNDAYSNLDDLFNRISNLCNEDGSKYIYAYCDEPDHSMHDLGTDDSKITEIILDLNNRIEELSSSLEDTVIFVIADHGHLNAENIMLADYPDIVDCLKELPSIEPRACNFFVKDEKKNDFEGLFNKYFNEYFDLYTKEDIIESKLFGDGEENIKFRCELGDYLAISRTKKCLVYNGDSELKSQHAGYTDDEVYIPLIVINK